MRPLISGGPDTSPVLAPLWATPVYHDEFDQLVDKVDEITPLLVLPHGATVPPDTKPGTIIFFKNT